MPALFKRSLAFIAAAILILDSIWLISLNKMHFGILLPLLIGVIFLCYALFFQKIQQILQKNPLCRWLYLSIWGIFWLWFASLLIFFGYLQQQQQSNHAIVPIRAMLILGSGIEHGQPSATLKQRLDVAAKLAQQQPYSFCIVTGGFDFTATQSEAQVMANYLIQQHKLPASRIFLENKSTSTELNLKNSQQILTQLGIGLEQPIAIVTSDFHSLRARAIAKHQGYQHIVSISADTPTYIRYNAWLREYFAYVSGYVLQEF